LSCKAEDKVPCQRAYPEGAWQRRGLTGGGGGGQGRIRAKPGAQHKSLNNQVQPI